MLPLLLDWVHKGELGLNQLVGMLCENPARIYGVSGKGRVGVGYDADLILIDLEKSWTIEPEWLQSKCGWSPFEGMQVHGKIEHVFLRGHHMVNEGALVGRMTGRPVIFEGKQ
ncbi:MAG: amidohydrolase family protein [Fimbriimonadaceae bacterium]|nr:amidohydrolase family protein [Fimbriimonadaceae bacterium]